MSSGASCVLEKEGKFLFQLRDNNPEIENPNKWGLFGGGIEDGETPVETVIREVKEELGIDLDEKKLEILFEGETPIGYATVFRHPLEHELKDLVLNEGQGMKLFTKEEIIGLKNLVSQKIVSLL